MVVVSQEWLTGDIVTHITTARALDDSRGAQGSSMTAGKLDDSRVLDDSRGKLVDGGGKLRMVDVGMSLLTFAGLGHCWL